MIKWGASCQYTIKILGNFLFILIIALRKEYWIQNLYLPMREFISIFSDKETKLVHINHFEIQHFVNHGHESFINFIRC